MPEAVRVVLVGMPAMLRQILREVVGRTAGLDAVAALPRQRLGSLAVLALEPDVLITGADEATEDEIVALLRPRWPARVLTLAPDGRSGVLHELVPRRIPFGELSPTALALVAGGRDPREAR